MSNEPLSNTYSNLAGYVAQRRRELGLTQVELSEKVGMSQEWASNVETGKIAHPRMKTMANLADALQVSLEHLLLVSGYATTAQGASEMAAQVDSVDDEMPPHLRASFELVGDLTGEPRRIAEGLLHSAAYAIDAIWREQQADRDQMTRDRERRLAEGIED